jgi:hypothetical protein
MNELNYTSIEASKKLVENGIVLNTKEFWYRYGDKWEDGPRIFIVAVERMPRPSMTELWRELPWFVMRNEVCCNLMMEKYDTFTVVYYDGTGPNYTDTDPADALAELLIWLRRER